LVGTGRWDERDQPLQKLVALHQDVRRPVPPAGLESQGEPSVGPHFEAIVCEGRAGDVAAEPLEPAPVACGDGDVAMEAHPAVLWDVWGRLGVGLLAVGLDAVAQPSPSLARAGAHRDARTQRRSSQRGEQRLVAGEGVVVARGSRCDESRDAARRPGQHARHLVRARRG
jgi:hypothetical protein